MTARTIGVLLTRALPAVALGLAAAGVSLTAVRLAGDASGAQGALRAAVIGVNAMLWWGFAALTVVRTPPVLRGPAVPGIVLVGLASTAAVSVAPAHAAAAGTAAIAASAAISLGSLCLAVVSLGRLGRCFGVLPDARGLVTGGPYRLVRHPLYLGELGAVAGIAVAASDLRNVLAFSALVAAQIARARLEERTLVRAFPEYAEYRRRTPMLVPWPRTAARAAAAGNYGRSPLSARWASRSIQIAARHT